jgi:protein DGCR14
LAVEAPSGDYGLVKSIETWKYTAKNSLMYVPDGVDLTHEEQMEQAKKERIIKHANTRFNPEALNALQNTTPSRTQATSQTNQISVGMLKPITKVGIDGKEAIKETPNVRGYSFVDASPSPMPGRLAGDESPMMTWGEIESTPFRLDPTGLTPRYTGGPEFKIPDIPEREKIAFNLEEQVSAARRKKKNEAIKQMQRNLASPSRNSPSISERINNMSPAAQRLLSSKVHLKALTPSPLSRTAQSSGIDTPSPFSMPKSPYLESPSAKTDSLLNLRSSLKRPSMESITDNLLKLPKNN